jgi:hypothetical protein
MKSNLGGTKIAVGFFSAWPKGIVDIGEFTLSLLKHKDWCIC